MASIKKCINSHTRLIDFIKTYPDEELQQGLKLLEESFPVHIAIKGDGNCFYRAFAFLYLSSNESNDYNKVFPQTIWICTNSKQIHSNQQFQDQLFQMWDKYVKNVCELKSQIEREKKILTVFNSIPIFDELMIGYFRSCTYHHMNKNKYDLLPFSENEPEFTKILDKVATFGNESEGTEINSLADAMKTKIMIFCIDHNGFHPIESGSSYEDKGYYLFFRPGHYDIVAPSYGTESNEEEAEERPVNLWLNLTNKINSHKEKKNETRRAENKETPYQSFKIEKEEQGAQNVEVSQNGSPEMRNTYNFYTKKETTAFSKYDRRFPSSYSEEKIKKENKFELPSWDEIYEKTKIEALGLLVIALTAYFLYTL